MYNSARRIRCRAIFAFLTASLFWIAASSIAQTQTASLGARQEFLKKLVAAAEDRTHHVVRYHPAYVRIPYPGGDVPGDNDAGTNEIYTLSLHDALPMAYSTT